MPKVPLAPPASDLHFPNAEQVGGIGFHHVLFRDRFGEAWPPRAGGEFGSGIEQRGPAADATVDPVAVESVVSSGAGEFGVALPRDHIGIERQLLSPLG